MPMTVIEITAPPTMWDKQNQAAVQGLHVEALIGDALQEWQKSTGMAAKFQPGDVVVLREDLEEAAQNQQRDLQLGQNFVGWQLLQETQYRLVDVPAE